MTRVAKKQVLDSKRHERLSIHLSEYEIQSTCECATSVVVAADTMKDSPMIVTASGRKAFLIMKSAPAKCANPGALIYRTQNVISD